MAQTRTIVAVDPATGARLTRRTARTYVAVVVIGDPAQGRAVAATWCGRPDLAEKALRKFSREDARLAPVVEGSWTEPPAAGRLSPRAVPAQPWDPGTPAARERVALQGERVAILWPIAQVLRGAGVALPLSWATDGPVMAGELTLNAALALLPLGAIAQAATALAALPPVTIAQDAALALCDTGTVPGRPHL
jgi:hypothetical protein